MARTRLTAVVAVAGVLTLAAPPMANAAMAVFDGTLIGKAIEQLNAAKQQLATQLEALKTLKDQLSFITDITKFVGDVSKAIGSVTHITLPIPNILAMSAQIKADARCLMPSGDLWGLTIKDLNLASICDTSSKYRSALFTNQKDLENMPFNEREFQKRVISARRSALLEDSAVRGLGLADVQMNQATQLNQAADQLQGDLDAASTVQDREHIAAQAQILQANAMAQQTQILAQMLKIQSAAEIKKGLPVDQEESTKTGDDDTGSSGQ